MKERPILFKAEMVRAILDGRKTQTRRVVDLRRLPHAEDDHGTLVWEDDEGYCHDSVERCPYGSKGTRLWVRETWATPKAVDRAKPSDLSRDTPIRYRSVQEKGPLTGRWRPSIHMPRWASRITLEVTGVRVERVQDISEGDAMAEGVDELDGSLDEGRLIDRAAAMHECAEDARVWFAELWDSINAKRGHSWESNPWVWVVEFKRVRP